jgi:4,5-dihydroxyphthalate decarboxylase
MNASAKTRLFTMLGDYPNTHALRTGALDSARVQLDFDDVKVPNRAFKSVVRDLKYDVSELAIVTFLQAYAYGKPLVLLPAVVGPGRYQHQCLVQNIERGLLSPADLPGRRVGVRAYAQTTGAWVRGILQADYGIDPASIHWVTFEEGHLAEYRDPPAVERAAPGRDMMAMLLAGELDAVIVGNDAPDDPRIRPVIPEPLAAACAWSDRYQAVPINHMMVVKTALAQSQPERVAEVFALLAESKRRGQALAPPGQPDMTPFGLEPNRRSLEIIIDYALRQGLIPRRFEVDELFDDATRALGAR